jgi:hypothetical protein
MTCPFTTITYASFWRLLVSAGTLSNCLNFLVNDSWKRCADNDLVSWWKRAKELWGHV